eukprot:TRINITY_DN4524_c0_g1_i9.p1 TRINITY_DN4524_c0_g1~~TRINITY_DN4524_c0_g1_i9.p1  ORF type:complete len:663 (+),score=50.57 TRINITY_DN4524_c0_g1_i9:170-1990(+)
MDGAAAPDQTPEELGKTSAAASIAATPVEAQLANATNDAATVPTMPSVTLPNLSASTTAAVVPAALVTASSAKPALPETATEQEMMAHLRSVFVESGRRSLMSPSMTNSNGPSDPLPAGLDERLSSNIGHRAAEHGASQSFSTATSLPADEREELHGHHGVYGRYGLRLARPPRTRPLASSHRPHRQRLRFYRPGTRPLASSHRPHHQRLHFYRPGTRHTRQNRDYAGYQHRRGRTRRRLGHSHAQFAHRETHRYGPGPRGPREHRHRHRRGRRNRHRRHQRHYDYEDEHDPRRRDHYLRRRDMWPDFVGTADQGGGVNYAAQTNNPTVAYNGIPMSGLYLGAHHYNPTVALGGYVGAMPSNFGGYGHVPGVIPGGYGSHTAIPGAAGTIPGGYGSHPAIPGTVPGVYAGPAPIPGVGHPQYYAMDPLAYHAVSHGFHGVSDPELAKSAAYGLRRPTHLGEAVLRHLDARDDMLEEAESQVDRQVSKDMTTEQAIGHRADEMLVMNLRHKIRDARDARKAAERKATRLLKERKNRKKCKKAREAARRRQEEAMQKAKGLCQEDAAAVREKTEQGPINHSDNPSESSLEPLPSEVKAGMPTATIAEA